MRVGFVDVRGFHDLFRPWNNQVPLETPPRFHPAQGVAGDAAEVCGTSEGSQGAFDVGNIFGL